MVCLRDVCINWCEENVEEANFETAQEVCSKSGSDTFFSKGEEKISFLEDCHGNFSSGTGWDVDGFSCSLWCGRTSASGGELFICTELPGGQSSAFVLKSVCDGCWEKTTNYLCQWGWIGDRGGYQADRISMIKINV